MDNKTLIDTVCRRTGINKKDASALLEALATTVTSSASEMDIIAIPGFGSFEPKKRLERVMSIPSSGKRLLLPPKITLGFRPAAQFKQLLRASD